MIRWMCRFPCSVVLVDIAGLQETFADGIDARPHWISHAEWIEAERLRDRRRRWEWLAGRLAARHALSETLAGTLPPAGGWDDLVVRTRNRAGLGIPPRAWLRGSRWEGSVSISHAAGLAVAAASPWSVGIDVASLEAGPVRNQAEPASGSVALPVREARHWTAKEAAFKAFGRDRPFVPGEWRVRPLPGGRSGFEASGPEGLVAAGTWHVMDRHCFAICGAPQTLSAFEDRENHVSPCGSAGS